MPLSKFTRLRAELGKPDLAFLMEAHDGMSAKIVEESGFKAIWASGLSISTALGVRDSNEASWTQVLEVLEFMSDATSVPILMDGDTGYGNFNNMRRLVRKLCQRQVAGVCIEDKIFPKTNSFVGQAQPLVDIDEFCGKIKAGKDSQSDDDFQIIARVEALISGLGMVEALRRAEAYHDAGADGILIHSKSTSAAEILAFSKEWAGRAPLVIVPTMYYSTPTEEFRKTQISAIIWANHNLRAAITAMRRVSGKIFEDEALTGVEDHITPVSDVFQLVGNPELAEAEKRYLPTADARPRAIVLAASRGKKLGPLTEDRPKCMVDIRGEPLLSRLVSTLRDAGIEDVAVVRGYEKDSVDLRTINTIDNDDWMATGEVASLGCAQGQLKGQVVLSYGDVLFRSTVLNTLMVSQSDITLAVDALWRDRNDRAEGRLIDFTKCSRPFTGEFLEDGPVQMERMGEALTEDEADGEWIGLAKLSEKGAAEVSAELDAMRTDGTLDTAKLPDLFMRLAARGVEINVVYVTGQWLDVNDMLDLAAARNMM